MKVSALMTKDVLTVKPDDPLDRVFFYLNFERIRHLPVVEQKKVVGIVSDRDLKKVMGRLKTKRSVTKENEILITIKSRTVKTMMRRNVLTISPNADSVEAAAIMAKRKIGALPVVNKGELVGIVSATDILRAYVKLAAAVGI